MALTQDRHTPARSGDIREPPVKAEAVIFAGAMVGVDATGMAVPAAATAALAILGRAEQRVDNSAGADGDRTVRVGAGIYRYANSEGGDEIGRNDIGKPAYVVDDETVALTDDDGARPVAGAIFDVDAEGVWVDFRATAITVEVEGG